MAERKILALFAHPDDEILGPGSTLAHYANQGVQIELVCATRGEAGEIADPSLATPATLPQVREAELHCSARALGIQRVHLLGYLDSGMAGTPPNAHPDAFINAPQAEVVPHLVEVIRRFRPQVLLTFEPYGGYGHPDHMAISEHTRAAFDAAADAGYRPDLGAAWQAQRLYYPLVPDFLLAEMMERMRANGLDVSFFENLGLDPAQRWPDDEIHCIVDVAAFASAKWEAFRCHATQFGADNPLRQLSQAEMATIFEKEYFAQARPLPVNGRPPTSDLFFGVTLPGS